MSLIALDRKPSYKRPKNDGKVTDNKVTYENEGWEGFSEVIGL